MTGDIGHGPAFGVTFKSLDNRESAGERQYKIRISFDIEGFAGWSCTALPHLGSRHGNRFFAVSVHTNPFSGFDIRTNKLVFANYFLTGESHRFIFSHV